MSDKELILGNENLNTLPMDEPDLKRKVKSPLQQERSNKKQLDNKQGLVSKYWPFAIAIPLVLGFIWLGTYEPSESSSESAQSMVITQPVQQEKQAESSDYIERQQSTEQVTNLSQILLEQKNQITQLEQENGQLKLAIIQNRRAIEQLQRNRNAGVSQATMAITKSKPYYPSRVLLTNMTLNDINVSIAWIKYQGKTYAVQVGDSLGGTRVISIDPQERLVVTNKGLIR
ncbi:hypothetical protein [Photorhabdus hainanensis]|uniref:hypothetical protein n=1 Tax=Photorhabdus hainanensis TaxID=1004166 RepID=UPI001BD3A3AD|nr:hypothetical protein [Photorhabdus hainanensis]MBS9434855.1 hypothetical protein [Photorhabdus hainanensis]